MISQLTATRITHAWIGVPGFEEIRNDEDADLHVSRSHLELYQALDRLIRNFESRVSVKLNVGQYQSVVHKTLSGIVDHSDPRGRHAQFDDVWASTGWTHGQL